MGSRRRNLNADVLILAAGAGQRAGGPKAWGLVGNRFWLEIQLDRLRASAPRHVRITLAAPPPESATGLLQDLPWVLNPAPELGPFLSLQIGLAALPPPEVPVFVLPVDVPAAGQGVFEALLSGAGGAMAAVPVVNGRGGHPVLLAPAARAALLALDPRDPDSRLDSWLRRDPAAVRRVAVGDACVLRNLNTREEMERFVAGA